MHEGVQPSTVESHPKYENVSQFAINFFLNHVYFILFYSLTKLAGVLLLGTSGMIRPMGTEHMETACKINEKKTIYPFAYRTHTHSLGKVVSGYKVRSVNGLDNWTRLGKRDPLTPQMFYPVENTEPIQFGDHLAARCTMESHRKRPTKIGYVLFDLNE